MGDNEAIQVGAGHPRCVAMKVADTGLPGAGIDVGEPDTDRKRFLRTGVVSLNGATTQPATVTIVVVHQMRFCLPLRHRSHQPARSDCVQPPHRRKLDKRKWPRPSAGAYLFSRELSERVAPHGTV